MPISERRKVFKRLREAQELFHDEDYTRSFNLLSSLEKTVENEHLKTNIAQMKIQCLVQVGNIEAAKHYMEQLLNENPLSAKINFIAGNFYKNIGLTDKASRLYLRSVCLFPANVQYALTFSQLLRDNHRGKEAIGILKKTLRVARKTRKKNDPALYFLYMELANLYFYSSYYGRSLLLFLHAAKQDKDFPYHDLIAECCLFYKEYDRAIEYINKHFSQWGETDPEALFILSKALTGVNKKNEALDVLDKCMKLWGEIVITAKDMTHLYPLMQDGSLKKIPNIIFDLQ
ncbi:MAG: hypothetical protein OEZ13_04525 [Spirochaetia bacterium]|nr:hypothetical protein [Spirochaetia bacterium]